VFGEENIILYCNSQNLSQSPNFVPFGGIISAATSSRSLSFSFSPVARF